KLEFSDNRHYTHSNLGFYKPGHNKYAPTGHSRRFCSRSGCGNHIKSEAVQMKPFVSLVLMLVMAIAPSIVVAQTPTSQDQDEVVRFRTNEVKLDVVVKDKKGRPIKDLKASDFEVLEDGVAQKVESFRFVSREIKEKPAAERLETTNTPATTTTTGPGKRSTPAVTALVFDRLSPEARSLAKKAGLAYADEGMANGGFTGVFGIDQALRTVQNFTDDTQQIKDAVERVTGTVISGYQSGAGKMRDN